MRRADCGNFVRLQTKERDGELVDVSIILLGHNVKRVTPSPKWASWEEFNAYAKTLADKLEAEARANLIALGWTPPY